MKPQTLTYFKAFSMLLGTIVGVGTFGIPYAFSRAGFFVGLGYLGALALVTTLMHLMYGEVTLRTDGRHRFIGYATRYLGSAGKRITMITSLVGLFGGLLAYTIAGGLFLQTALSPFVAMNATATSLMFFCVVAWFIVRGTNSSATAELVMTTALLVLLAIIIGRTIPDISPVPLLAMGNASDLFLPYGVVLFALAGGSVIPELQHFMRTNGYLRSVIVTGTLGAAALYAVFATAVVGAFGYGVSSDAISSLAVRYGSWMSITGGIAGMLIVATSFLSLGLVAKHELNYDLGFSKVAAACTVLAIPLFLFFVASRNFVGVIGFIGGVFMGIEGIVTIFLWRAARYNGDRVPEYALRIPRILLWVIGILFAAGSLYEIIYTLR